MLQLLRPGKSIRAEEENRYDIKERLWATLVDIFLLVILHPRIVSAGQLGGCQLLRCKLLSIWWQLLDLQLLGTLDELAWQLRHAAAALGPP